MTDEEKTARFEVTRRDVNISLLAVALGAVGLPMAASVAPVHLFDFAIAGGPYHELPKVLPGLRPGTRLVLVREPNNPHDANAVAVHSEAGAKLGFIPRRANAPIAQLLDAGHMIYSDVRKILELNRAADVPDDLVFTSVASGDPVIRLTTFHTNNTGSQE